MERSPGTFPRAILWFQGIYFVFTGVWPLISIETFQKVTGRKTDHLITGNEGDHWLVMTVGVLVTAIGLSILLAAARSRLSGEVVVLAMGSSAGLLAIDVIYVARGAILPIYLVDAALEGLLLLAWGAALLFDRSPS
jgi:hypothetical protein